MLHHSCNNPAFTEAVENYLSLQKNQFNYQNLVTSFMEIERFYAWVQHLKEYRSVEDAVVLSPGCGAAGDLFAFMEQGAAKVYGLEVEKSLHQLAQLRFKGSPYEQAFDFQVYDGDTFPYADQSFDIVFSTHVIEHTHQPLHYLYECLRVLRPGGVLFLDVPNRYYPIEQHVQLKYIHQIPSSLRNIVVRFLLSPYSPWSLNKDTHFRIGCAPELNIPSAKQLLQSLQRFQKHLQIELADAYFHSYTLDKFYYGRQPIKYLWKRYRQQTTFRLVVRKVATNARKIHHFSTQGYSNPQVFVPS